MRKTRFKKLLWVGLGNIVSGIFFGVGCILVEHADNKWWNAETDTSQQEEVADEDTSDTTPVSLTATKSGKPAATTPKLASKAEK